MNILGNIQKFTPYLYDINNESFLRSHANMIKTTNDMDIAAKQEYSKLVTALNSYDLAPEDEHIRQETLDEINKIINDNTLPLGSGPAYGHLLKEGTDAANNQALLKAARNKILYNKELERVKTLGLSNDMVDWWDKTYGYKGINASYYINNNGDRIANDNGQLIDEQGNIVFKGDGVTPETINDYQGNVSIKDYKPDYELLESPNIKEILTLAKNITNEDAQTTDAIEYLIEASSDNNTVIRDENTYKEYISLPKVQNAILSIIHGTHKYYAAFKQRQNYEIQRYNENPIKYSQYANANNLTYDKYIISLLGGDAKAISYNKEIIKTKNQNIKYGNNNSGAGNNNNGLSVDQNLTTVGSTPIETTYTEDDVDVIVK